MSNFNGHQVEQLVDLAISFNATMERGDARFVPGGVHVYGLANYQEGMDFARMVTDLGLSLATEQDFRDVIVRPQ